jgi:hypothetical protein
VADFELVEPDLRVRLEAHEADLIRQLAGEMRPLLEADVPRIDPVMTRLFPDAYESQEDQEKYRELVEDELRAKKLDALRSVEEKMGRGGAVDVPLSPGEIEQWLTFLTDVRLAIGTRMDVTEEKMAAEIEGEDSDAAAMSVLHWLGWLQESILEEINP